MAQQPIGGLLRSKRLPSVLLSVFSCALTARKLSQAINH